VTVLALDKVTTRPWGPPLLQAIDLALEAGEVLGVMGPNGAGKSSLLKLVSGDMPAHAGTISFLGKPLSRWTLRERARRLAVLPQLSQLDFPYTVEEVVGLGRTPHDTGRAGDREIVCEAMAAFDVTALRHRRYTELSGGERQRAQLARVFAQVWRPGERLLALHRGQAYALGTPREVISETLFREVFAARVHLGRHPVSGNPLVLSP
jgi:iron complex transport system ATP-binding protein